MGWMVSSKAVLPKTQMFCIGPARLMYCLVFTILESSSVKTFSWRDSHISMYLMQGWTSEPEMWIMKYFSVVFSLRAAWNIIPNKKRIDFLVLIERSSTCPRHQRWRWQRYFLENSKDSIVLLPWGINPHQASSNPKKGLQESLCRHSTCVSRWSLEWLVESTTVWSILDFLTAPFNFSYGDRTLSSFPFLKLCNSLPTLRGLPALTRMLLNQWLKLQEEYQSLFTSNIYRIHAECQPLQWFKGPSHSSHLQPVSSLHMVEDSLMPYTITGIPRATHRLEREEEWKCQWLASCLPGSQNP